VLRLSLERVEHGGAGPGLARDRVGDARRDERLGEDVVAPLARTAWIVSMSAPGVGSVSGTSPVTATWRSP
jgi:hypothetical protein